MNVSLTKLVKLNILTNDGHIVNHLELTEAQEIDVIFKLRNALSLYTPEEFLKIHSFTPIFPDCLVYMIIRDNVAGLKI
jgi:hypothetical protein